VQHRGLNSIAQTTLLGAILAILIYVAVVVTGSFIGQTTSENDPVVSRMQVDSAVQKQMLASPAYVHKSDASTGSLTILLNGITLREGEFILLYDSTPYASRGHIALTLPCDSDNPGVPIFQLLTGRAPDLVSHPPTYLPQLSSPPDTCLYHAQLGFGDPVTDVALKNISGEEVTFRGPHTVTITAHESYLPETPSPLEAEHQ